MNVPATSPDLPDAYATAVTKKTTDQQRIEGEQAQRLIESSKPVRDPEPQPLPPDATYSRRV
jgi:hypothetical protein